MKKREIYGYLIGIAIAELVGTLAQLISGSGNGFLDSLNQPPLTPPGWLFPVVWAILYALMGAASYQIYREDSEHRRGALILYASQLAVNFLWPIVFFRFEAIGLAAIILIVLNLLIILTIVQFWKIRRSAALLMLPYLAWTLFALYLNIGLYVLNGGMAS